MTTTANRLTVAPFRQVLGRPLRVGGIDYLNSRPLIECFDEVAGDEVRLTNHVPSELARRLRSRELDVALVPIVEYFLSPCAAEYRVVPGLGISSYGAVESICLFHRVPLGRVERVALDSTSRTSQLLTRLFLAERPTGAWRSPDIDGATAPRVESSDPDEILAILEGRDPGGAESFDAALLIGDSALRVEPRREWRSIDLGLEWTRWTGLPFVYALWVHHGDALPGIAECFQTVAHRGFARIDAIVDRGPLPPGMSRSHAIRYLSQVIRYGLGAAELEAVRVFVRRLRRAELIGADAPEELRFLAVGD